MKNLTRASQFPGAAFIFALYRILHPNSLGIYLGVTEVTNTIGITKEEKNFFIIAVCFLVQIAY